MTRDREKCLIRHAVRFFFFLSYYYYDTFKFGKCVWAAMPNVEETKHNVINTQGIFIGTFCSKCRFNANEVNTDDCTHTHTHKHIDLHIHTKLVSFFFFKGTRREIEKLRLMALIQGQQLLRHFSKNNATRKKQNNCNEPTLSD